MRPKSSIKIAMLSIDAVLLIASRIFSVYSETPERVYTSLNFDRTRVACLSI
jgi:hypothetical protein